MNELACSEARDAAHSAAYSAGLPGCWAACQGRRRCPLCLAACPPPTMVRSYRTVAFGLLTRQARPTSSAPNFCLCPPLKFENVSVIRASKTPAALLRCRYGATDSPLTKLTPELLLCQRIIKRRRLQAQQSRRMLAGPRSGQRRAPCGPADLAGCHRRPARAARCSGRR